MQFDQLIDRTTTDSFKWNKYQGKDILPMWVADADFRCAEPILDLLRSRLDHGVLGYHLPAQQNAANQAVVDWLKRRYDWQIKPHWIVWTPGVVPAFNVACKGFCQPGDKVMLQTPNYPPLLAAPGLNQMQQVAIPTIVNADRWMLDFDRLEQEAKDPACKLLILCNPMNPVGSVLTDEELSTVADICERHNVLLCSDEIHCDLILEEGIQHLPAGKHPQLTNRSITLMAASKTFNIAGLGTSFAVIPDAALRRQFTSAAQGIVPWANVMGMLATQAAFTECDEWYDGLITYLRGNRDYLYEQVNSISGLSLRKPQATYLAWIDASGLDHPDPQAYFESKGVGPSPGKDFGEPQFVRINYACPRSYLQEMVSRLSIK